VELPVDMPAPVPSVPQQQNREAGANAIAFVILYSLTLAAGGGYVFYASIRPVSIPTGYGVPLTNFPWIVAYLVLAASWLAGLVALLIAGLIHLHRYARRKWWSAERPRQSALAGSHRRGQPARGRRRPAMPTPSERRPGASCATVSSCRATSSGWRSTSR
jgi:hypothetical protein